MNFDDYQYAITRHLEYEGMGGDLLGIVHATMGLGSAYGKIAELAQVWVSDWQRGDRSPKDIEPMRKEIANALAYVIAIATEVGLVADDVAEYSTAMLKGSPK